MVKCEFCDSEAEYILKTSLEKVANKNCTYIGIDDELWDKTYNVCHTHAHKVDAPLCYGKKNGEGWFYTSHIKDAKVKRYAKISSVEYHGANDYPFGLHMTFDLEDGGGVGWSLYMRSDINDFLRKMKVSSLMQLRGKIVETWWAHEGFGGQILGVTINERLV